jgi:hypothetical protein
MPKKPQPSLEEEVTGTSTTPPPKAATSAPAPVTPAPQAAAPRTLSTDIVERLDQIALHLRHLDRRDRVRMFGSTLKSLVSLGTLAFVIWSSVYFVQHLDDIIKTMTQEMAKQTMQYGKAGSEDLMKQLQDMMKPPASAPAR